MTTTTGGCCGAGFPAVGWVLSYGTRIERGPEFAFKPRRYGLTASSRAAASAGDGSATANVVAATGSRGRPVKPDGSITKASC